MAEPAKLDRKISDARLRSFAHGDSERRRVVLLELNLAKPTLKFGKTRKIGRRKIPSKRLFSSDSDTKLNKQRTTRMQKILDDAGVEHRLLRSSGVILAKVYPEELRKVAKSTMIKAIHPNRVRSS